MISVTNVNIAPTMLALSNASIPENTVAGTDIGTLSTTDPDAGEVFTYTLVPAFGDNGNSKS